MQLPVTSPRCLFPSAIVYWKSQILSPFPLFPLCPQRYEKLRANANDTSSLPSRRTSGR